MNTLFLHISRIIFQSCSSEHVKIVDSSKDESEEL